MKQITLAKKNNVDNEKDLVFSSVKEASKFLGLSQGHFSAVMNGRRKNKTGYYISFY